MPSFSHLYKRYRQFGGLRLIREYGRMGLIGTIFKEFCRCIIERKSFKTIYSAIGDKVCGELKRQFEPVLLDSMASLNWEQQVPDEKKSNIIWFCWFQGKQNFPPIVQACYNSIKRNEPEREIKLIDGQNYKEYIEIPEYVENKWEKGYIPAATFSDIIRLELLVRYGGTWIDSTVLVTGKIPSEYMDSELFMPQYTVPGSKTFRGISSWFITSKPENAVLQCMLNLFYAYWKEYNCLVWYYIIHLFFQMIAEKKPIVVEKMPYAYSRRSLVLMHHWGENADDLKWQKITESVKVHKLTFRVQNETVENIKNYYNFILREFN